MGLSTLEKKEVNKLIQKKLCCGIIQNYTAEEASALNTGSNRLIYVTTTNGTFTSVGLWYWDGSAWVSAGGGGGGGNDPDAIHDNVASEISAITNKSTLVAGDFFIIEDSAAGNIKKSTTLANLESSITITESQISDLIHADATAIHDNISSEISAIANKATPVGGDFLIIEDSEAANAKKHILISALPSDLSFGSDQQIPFTNAGGTDYDYDAGFTFDDVNDLLTVGNNTGSPEIRLSKEETGTAKLAFYNAGVEEGYIRSNAIEVIEINTLTNGDLQQGGATKFRWTNTDFASLDNSGGRIIFAGASLTVPLVGRRSDTNSGLGADGSDNTALISNAKSALVTSNAGTATNVELFGSNALFGATTAGEGVLRFNDVTTAPAGTMASGALVYVSGENLVNHSDAGDTYNLNNPKHDLQIRVFDGNTSVTTGDSNFGITIPSFMDGYELTNVICSVHTKGITGTTDVTIERRRAGTNADMLSTAVTIGDEFFAQDGTVDTANDDVQTGDEIYANVDAVHSGTAPLGLNVVLEFTKPV